MKIYEFILILYINFFFKNKKDNSRMYKIKKF